MKLGYFLLALLLLPLVSQIHIPMASNDYTAITYLPYDIRLPGKYRLEIVGNVTINGTSIRILRTHDVLLDLNGKFLLGYGSGSGIMVFNSSNIIITNGVIENFEMGINATDSFNVSISNCIIGKTFYGIRLLYSSLTRIYSCTVRNCTHGLMIHYSSDITVNDTEITKIKYYAAYIDGSSNTILCNCNLSTSKSSYGIFILGYSNNLLLYNCCFTKSYKCLLAMGVQNITAFGCSISGTYGFVLHACSHVNLVFNNFTRCSEYALGLFNSDNITAFLNNFIDNGIGLYCDDVYMTQSSALWYSPTPLNYMYQNRCYVNYLGNYWDTFYGQPDYNKDGIYDNPHLMHYPYTWIDDYYPLVKTKEHYLLRKTLEINYTVEIVEGWGTFSLAAIPESCKASVLFKDDNVVLYEWDPSTNSYTPAEDVVPGKGYWIFSTKKISKRIFGNAVDEETLYLRQGWNLIATIYSPKGGQVKLTCLNGSISHVFYEWSPSQRAYIPVTQLQPEKVYWVYAFENSTIVLSQT